MMLIPAVSGTDCLDLYQVESRPLEEYTNGGLIDEITGDPVKLIRYQFLYTVIYVSQIFFHFSSYTQVGLPTFWR